MLDLEVPEPENCPTLLFEPVSYLTIPCLVAGNLDVPTGREPARRPPGWMAMPPCGVKEDGDAKATPHEVWCPVNIPAMAPPPTNSSGPQRASEPYFQPRIACLDPAHDAASMEWSDCVSHQLDGRPAGDIRELQAHLVSGILQRSRVPNPLLKERSHRWVGE